MFVDMVQKGRIEQGQCPARRPVFLRLHGVAYGQFEIVPNLDKKFKVGLFGKQSSYPVWVRYASDIPDGRPDFKSTIGIGIKLFDVPGKKILSPDENSPTIDFLLQNIDVFFVDNAHEMCEFTKASLTGKAEADAWLKNHPRTAQILDEMEKVAPSVLKTPLWSCIPFQFGKNHLCKHFCKYKLEPEVVPEGAPPNYNDPNYLAVDLETRLKKGEVRLRFLVQLQTHSETMPIDRATVSWSEEVSQPIHVATLILPAQDITSRNQSDYGETLSFNVWRTLEEHTPVGSIAESRKSIYQASAELRRNVNGEPIGEAQVVRPPTEWPAAKDTHIVRAAIHPGIGVARIGNSEGDYFIGPEVTSPQMNQGETRDAKGAIKRQAARFRIYGYNAAGEAVKEITNDDAYIEWTAHLVNRKAQWYQFQCALDIPEAANLQFPHRNPKVLGNDRYTLAIDPGSRTIEGKNQNGSEYQFDTGKFQDTPVPLGEIRTDESGRLLVLGGHGYSASPQDTPVYDPANPNTFNNADGWFDDTSDGPITAKVTIGSHEIPVDPSWVIVAPPNYGPGIIGWRTAYDLLVDAYVECGWLTLPKVVSFTRDVLPSLSRLSNLQWVNQGFAAIFGKGRPMDFENPDLIAQLAYRPETESDPDPYVELRRTIFNSFRPANTQNSDPSLWPWIYGDAFGSDPSNPPSSPRNNLSLSKVRMYLLECWVKGDFINDWESQTQPPQNIEQVPLSDQPAMLDQAALTFCLADAFHPGCEMTWPMRHSTIYAAPFRIRHRPSNEPEPNYGKNLTTEIALQVNGPLYAQSPGDVTRWMALPWQADTAFCRSGYEPEYDPYLPTFWPARVPNQVLTESDYKIVIDESLPRQQRLDAYNNRASWLRSLTGSSPQQMLQMIKDFGHMGILEARPGIKDDPDFPELMFVECLSPEQTQKLEELVAVRLTAQIEKTGEEKLLEKAGWESREQLEEFRRIIGL